MIYYFVCRNDNYHDIFEMAGCIKGRNTDLLTKINPSPIFRGVPNSDECKKLLRIFQSEVLIYIQDANCTNVLGCCSVELDKNDYCVWVKSKGEIEIEIEIEDTLIAKLKELVNELRQYGFIS